MRPALLLALACGARPVLPPSGLYTLTMIARSYSCTTPPTGGTFPDMVVSVKPEELAVWVPVRRRGFVGTDRLVVPSERTFSVCGDSLGVRTAAVELSDAYTLQVTMTERWTGVDTCPADSALRRALPEEDCDVTTELRYVQQPGCGEPCTLRSDDPETPSTCQCP